MKRKRTRRAGTYACPSCFQVVDTSPDPGGGPNQEYVEDCSVCCRPNLISATYSEEEQEWYVEARPENG